MKDSSDRPPTRSPSTRSPSDDAVGGEVIRVDFHARRRARSDGAVSTDGFSHGTRANAGGALGGPETVGGEAAGTDLASGARCSSVLAVFSSREAAKLLGVTPARLRALARAGVVPAATDARGRRSYTFQDLLALRTARDLLARRVRLRDVEAAVGALRRALPRVTRPLHELRIVSDGRRLVVQADGTTFEPLSGQMVLDFPVALLEADVARVLRPDFRGSRRKRAYELYTRASALDEDPASFAEAEALYQEAIRQDPSLAIAYTNLGNLKFRSGDEGAAVTLYEKALLLDAGQPEAHYNLGYVKLERGDATGAVHHFLRAIAADSRFADAHFNLAMALEQSGRASEARRHWKRYLELEPEGPWSDIAREHL